MSDEKPTRKAPSRKAAAKRKTSKRAAAKRPEPTPEVVETPEVTETPVVEEVVETPEVTDVSVEEQSVEEQPVVGSMDAVDMSPLTPDEHDPNFLKWLKNDLRAYVQHMSRNNPISETDGKYYQEKLYEIIRTATQQRGEDFATAYKLLYKTFRYYKNDAFSVRLLWRFHDKITMTLNNRRNYERLLNLISATASVPNISLVKSQVDFDATLKFVESEDQRQKILTFYSV